MDAGRSFDESARGAELRLAELRRLLSGSIELTAEQESALALLTETLAGVEQGALALRNAVLNAPEAPAGFVERVYERLPEGFDPSGWSTETYVTPVTAAWGNEFAEKPGGEITVDSLFDQPGGPIEETLSVEENLETLFTELARVYENEPTLLTGRDPQGRWCVLVTDRAPTVMRFLTESERGAWLGRVYASALIIPGESSDEAEQELRELERRLGLGSQENREDLDEGNPSARVPVPVPPPANPGGGERTFDEALAAPRNP